MTLLLNPNIAYVLLVGGFLLAILALFSPGTGLLEVGALFILLLAGYSIYHLAFNWWALVILLLGVFPFLLALRKSRRWIFLLLSVLALIVGSVFLFREPGEVLAINPILASLVSVLSAGFLWLIGTKGLEALGKKPSHDPERVVGMVGEARSDIFQEGTVYVDGEEWSAQSNTPIPEGSQVRIISRIGLVLSVERIQPPDEV